MRPKIILHNSISLDGSLTSFEPNMQLHYQIAGWYKPDAHLIGSNTIKAGIELFGDGVLPEEPSDFQKPKRDMKLPLWVVIDSGGTLEGLLHTCRRFELCRDVVVIVSKKTPKRYLQYLDDRQYGHHCVGTNSVDLKEALYLLSKKYHVKKVLTDTGRILGNLLLNQDLVDEISLLVHPVIVGKESYTIFSEIDKNLNVSLVKCKRMEQHYLWLVYQTKKRGSF